MQQDAYEQVGPTTNLLAVCEQLHVARTQESTDRSIQNALRGHVTHQCRQHNFCIPAGPLSRAHRPFSAFSPWAAMGPSVPHLSHNYQFLSQAQQPMFKEFQMGEAPYSSAMFSFAPHVAGGSQFTRNSTHRNKEPSPIHGIMVEELEPRCSGTP